MTQLNRRAALQMLAAFSTCVSGSAWQQSIGLCIGTYGMKMLSNRTALELIAQIGYDGVEICLLPGWPADPVQLDHARRVELRKLAAENRLALPAVLESLPLLPGHHTSNLERLRRAAQLAHDVAPGNTSIIDTILGLKANEWETSKSRMADEVGDWSRVALKNKITIGIKPHADQAMNSPERALWLVQQINSPHIRLIYDYSHMSIEGFALKSSLVQMLPYTAFISLKDGRKTAAGSDFLLPGEGNTDYPSYFRLLRELNYQGYLSVEVSALLFRRPGYDPEAAAKKSYLNLSPLMAAAGIRSKRA